MKHLIIILFTIIFSLNSQAQEYSAVGIPDSLKENAHSVLRSYIKDFKLNTINSGTEKVHKVITILNKNGDADAELYLMYDPDSKLSINKARIYDKNGKLVKKIKDSEIYDVPKYESFTLFSDNRVKYYAPNFAEYPYTVEYEYEYSHKNLISYNYISPFGGTKVSTQYAKYTFSYPEGVTYSKKELYCSVKPIHGVNNGMQFDQWEFANCKAIESEPFSYMYKIPSIMLMPTKLIYNQYEGSASNWNEYGKWLYSLFKGRNIIDEKEKPRIDAVLHKAKSRIDSIKFLYEYMQNRTRYVNVTLGIGGYQPFTAQSVYENGYGDCKALSNYMCSLLTYAGIESYPTLVCAGDYPKPVYFDYPNFKTFNHVIACVPNQGDTIWLECTNQSSPFGFLGHFTDNRDVLLLTPNGGKWARTKMYTPQQNSRICNAHFTIDSLGNASTSIDIAYSALQYDDVYQYFLQTTDLQRKWLYKTISLPSMQILSYTIENNKALIPTAKLSIKASSLNYCTFSGNYMIMPLNLINVQEPIEKMMKKRTTDFVLDYPSTDYDTITFIVPANYSIGAMPADKEIKSDFGRFLYKVRAEGNKVTYYREYELSDGHFPAADYKRFYDFVISVSKADNIKLMLTKK